MHELRFHLHLLTKLDDADPPEEHPDTKARRSSMAALRLNTRTDIFTGLTDFATAPFITNGRACAARCLKMA